MEEKASVVRTFRDLIAWQRGMSLALEVYRATASMPSDERFGLTSQLRRSVVSIPSNIAEGYARGTTQDYIRFLRIARGSLAEVQTQIELGCKLGMIRESEQTTELIAETDRVLQGLIRSLETKLRAEGSSS
jgi:four helix bundle protein